MKQLSFRITRFVLPLIFSAIISFSAVYGGNFLFTHKPVVYAKLKEWKLVPLPETLTELYFEDHLNLPKRVEKDKDYLFRFTIHNLEYKDMKYSYQITAVGSTEISNQKSVISTENRQPTTDNRQLISEGKISLHHDEYKTIEASFSAKRDYGRVKIEVNLVEKNQPIHFWLDGMSEVSDQ